MSPAPKEKIDQARNLIREILGDSASEIFLQRLDVILNDWAVDKITAAQSFEKIQKNVGLFIDENMANEISKQCAPIINQELSE